MTDSLSAGDFLGGGLGRVALAICILAAVALIVPFALATIGFGAILGVAGGSQAPSPASPRTQAAIGTTRPAAPAPLLPPATTDSRSPYAPELLAQARGWLGTRYVFGGCSPTGVDCSCFVQTIFRSVGVGLPRTSQLQYDATVGRGFSTNSPEPGDLVFFFHTYSDPGQDWTHVGVVSRIDANGTVWMIDAPGARTAGDPPDAPFGRVRDEPIAGSWLQHRPTYARIPAR